MARPSWDEVWMDVAHAVARRSRCDRRHIGAVIVGPNNRIVATGYNGPPAGLSLEDGSTCSQWCARARDDLLTPSYDNCPTVHAEANALMYADRRLYDGGTLYVTASCCWDCGKLVANSGIKRVVMQYDERLDGHRDPEKTMFFMDDCGLEVTTC